MYYTVRYSGIASSRILRLQSALVKATYDITSTGLLDVITVVLLFVSYHMKLIRSLD